MPNTTRFVPVSQLRRRMAALLAEIETSDVEIVITNRGRPVGRLVRPVSAFGWMAGTATVVGDLVSPEPAWDLDASVFPN